jgi:pyrimidine-specific ribonucleoside hydrolase
MRNLIIDCDPGHDDAVAILIALAYPEALKLKAVTTVCGNNTLEKVTRNAQHILTVADASTILAAGALRPLIGEPIISTEFHGETGMDGPAVLPLYTYPVSTRHAVEIMRMVLEEGEQTAIAALGPLTNIALLIRLYPSLLSRIEVISLMGGAIEGGNCTQDAEFNIFVDPEAAAIVFSSGVPIVMSGLNVTSKTLIRKDQIEHLRKAGRIGKFFCELMDFYGSKSKKFNVNGCMLHDPCAIAWLLHPEIFSGEKQGIDILLHGNARGKTVISSENPESVLVLKETDAKSMAELIITSIETINGSNQ